MFFRKTDQPTETVDQGPVDKQVRAVVRSKKNYLYQGCSGANLVVELVEAMEFPKAGQQTIIVFGLLHGSVPHLNFAKEGDTVELVIRLWPDSWSVISLTVTAESLQSLCKAQ